MRYSEGPTTEAKAVVHASVEVIWALITDIDLPARFSSEFQGAEWIDDGPALGATFAGQNQHAAIGDWRTTCTVTRYAPLEAFEWSVGDPEASSARWRFTLETGIDGVVLRKWMQMGPLPRGLLQPSRPRPTKRSASSPGG